MNHKTKHTHFRHTLSCEELPPGYRRHNIPPGAPVNLSSSRDTERAVFVPTQRRSNTSRRRRAPQHGRLVRVTTLFVGNCQLLFCWRGGALKDFEEKVPWSFYFFGGGMNLQYNYLIHISYIYIYTSIIIASGKEALDSQHCRCWESYDWRGTSTSNRGKDPNTFCSADTVAEDAMFSI